MFVSFWNDTLYLANELRKKKCICPEKSHSKLELRRHLVQQHSFTMMDACSLSEKRGATFEQSSTMVKPASVIPVNTAPVEPVSARSPFQRFLIILSLEKYLFDQRKVPCPLCGVVLYDKWTTRKHLMGKERDSHK